MPAKGASVEAFVKEGLQFIKVTLETGKKVTLVYERSAFGKTSNLMTTGAIWEYDHPMLTVCCALGIIASIAILAFPESIAVPILASLGFTAEGVKSASAAAAAQSSIGNVVSGSPFAILQSAGAGGAGRETVGNLVRWVCGAVIVEAAFGCFKWCYGSKTKAAA